MGKYNHLTLAERDVITTVLSEKKSLGDIAKVLGRSKSTLSRELKRNSSPEYKLYLSTGTQRIKTFFRQDVQDLQDKGINHR